MDEEEEEEDSEIIKEAKLNKMKKHRHKYKKQLSNNCVSNIYKMEDDSLSRTLCGCVQFNKFSLVVLVFGFLTMCVSGMSLKAQGFGGGKDGDPAPGRSPGPPLNYYKQLYSVNKKMLNKELKHKREIFGPTWPDIDDKTNIMDDESTIFVSAGDVSYENDVENSSELETPWCDAYASVEHYTPGSANDVSFNLSHSLFVVEDGLVPGITYQVQLRFALELKDFSLTTLHDGKLPVDTAHFICASPMDVTEQKDMFKMSGLRPNERFIRFNWTITPSMDVKSANITFRIRYRLEGTDVVLESNYNYSVLKECRLRLWNENSNFTWLALPRGRRKTGEYCVVSFPRTTGPTLDQGPGLVVSITRLNVPCTLGRLILNSTSSPGRYLCGKLEEIPTLGREIYFPYNTVPPQLKTTGNPVFELSYRFVDYCFNVTYTSKNGSFEVRPSSTLHCNYRILLPFGYRVSLTLKIGSVVYENTNSLQTSRTVPERLSVSTLNPDDPDPSCSGFLIRLWDGPTSWTHCAVSGDPVRELHVISRENRIALRVTSKTLEDQHTILRLIYDNVPIQELVQQCEFGWVGMKQYCVTVVENRKLTWEDAEKECVKKDGHLLSIRSEQTQSLVDNLLKYSPGYMDHNAYWIGATDEALEGDFQWVDAHQFSYTNWFPGWSQYEHTKQPNDDGLSDQDCVELRRSYHVPNVATSPVTYTQRLTSSFMWNDRDCTSLNYFLCEKLKKGADPFEEQQSECNRTVTLTPEQPRAIVTSPGFPRTYPDNVECYTEVQAPQGFRLVLEFDELVMEHETHCSYDMLEVIEQTNGSSRPWRMCGDWSQKLKLLRHVTSNNVILMHFVSDYSHHFGGYKARVSMERANTECADDRLQMFNNSCYLFVSYPEVTWQTAKQICKGMKSELASIHSPDEERFIVTKIRESREYSTSTIYWLGAQQDGESTWHWVDGTILSYSAWLNMPSRDTSDNLYCLSLQWMASPSPLLPSSLYWQPQLCGNVGGYICKKENQVSGSGLNLNGTVNGTEGRITSPRFPASYYHNLDYYVTIVAPESSRIVVKFSKLDLEVQPDCLYDFLELQGSIHGNDSPPPRRLCGHCDSTELDRLNFVSEGNELVVHFHSDYSISGGGFAFTWSSVDVSGCPLQTLTAKEGIISSPNYPQFLLAHLDCSTTILAPAGRRVWLEITDCNVEAPESELELNLGGDTRMVRPFSPNERISDGVFVSVGERLQVRLKTGDFPRGRGFRAIYKTVQSVKEQRVLELSNMSGGHLYHVNYPQEPPPNLDFTDRLVAPIGRVIHLQFHHAVPSLPSFLEDEDEHGTCPEGRGIIEVRDNYADTNGTWWRLCEASQADREVPPLAISSYLNTLHVRQINQAMSGVRLNASVTIRPDINYKSKLLRGSAESAVESCKPNPCLNGGKCASSGSKKSCQCVGHFTGMFCALTLCELDPCLFGRCELTPNGFACHCSRGYQGDVCDTKQKPCADNPCEGRGDCIERPDSTFHCRCFAWWEGTKCERRMMHIPYKPLSQRMLQEPFWLGLITVTVVLGVLGLFWCAKRHFPEKLEKLLAEEADRGRHCHISGRTPSLREQLAGPMYNTNPLAVAAGGGSGSSGPSRTLFGRLGIRKPSLLSLSSPLVPPAHTARTFSLDDLLKPPPRRTPSPRKKRNNSTPVKKTAAAEKKQILQQLVTPAVRRSSEDIVAMTTARIQGDDGLEIQSEETSFTTKEDAAKILEQNQKLEKKVTFARLLSKVSSEMSSGSEMETNNSCGGVSSVSITVGGVPVNSSSPTSELKSPHSTSSNQGSDSLSSSEITLALPTSGEAAKRPGRLLFGPPKTSSADSILAMFRNFSSTSAMNGGLGSSSMVSPSTTPTASSPQDDIAGSDESSTATPISTSSGPSDSPPLFTRRHTIQVSVLDPLSAQKTAASSGGSNLLHPPSILLEVPNKCLSPIREVPTPSPSPALTPVMPRHQMSTPLPGQKCTNLLVPVPFYSKPPNRLNLPPPSLSLPSEEVCVPINVPVSVPMTVPVSAATSALMIPTLTVQQPSPTRPSPPIHVCPGSPPPHKEKTLPRGKFLKELDKPTSLDLPVPPPVITVTCSMSEVESDADSPATKSGVGNSGGMCYLSPFSMCSRADRTTSESNLSSSGYSSMASPGPSRCGSNNPLCPPDTEDPHHNIRRPSPLLKTPSGLDEKGRPLGCCHRGRSDSETLSDDPQVESNDEGFGTDHLEEKIEDGELKSAKELEVFIGMELLDSGKTLIELPTSPSRIRHCGSIESDLQCKTLSPRAVKHCSSIEADLNCYRILAPPQNFKVRHCGSIDESLDVTKLYKTSKVKLCGNIDESVSSKVKTTFQLPSIVVDPDPSGNDVHCSPVSSRSESPLSDKTGGLGRFSPMFYGRLTDSDGIYDCASSDCCKMAANRKPSGRRKERRRSKSPGNVPKESAPQLLLDVPGKSLENSCRHSTRNKPSPKRRARTQQLASSTSSSSSESLNSIREVTMCLGTGEKCSDHGWTNTPDTGWASDTKRVNSNEASGEETGEDVTSQMLPKIEPGAKPAKKLCRMRTIGHQIRFLRRLETSLKRRESPERNMLATTPLLVQPPATTIRRSTSGGRLARLTRHRATVSDEPLLTPEEISWRRVTITGSGHTD